MPNEGLSEETLLPCPFCGGEAEIVHIAEGENAGGSCVSCTRCLASSNVEFEFKENFVSNWNRRPSTPSAGVEGVDSLRPSASQLGSPSHRTDGDGECSKGGLAPCPFCGCAPTVIPSGDGTGTMIECLTPDCVNPHVSYYGEGAAAKRWDRRAPAAKARCERCDRGEITGCDDGSWVELEWTAGGAHETGPYGSFGLILHEADRSERRRTYVATDLAATPLPPVTPAAECGAEGIPSDILDRVLAVGPVEWGATAEKPDLLHIADFARSLRLTREQFDTPSDVALHGAYLASGETVLCHTGTSPNSGQHARILVGAWNRLHDLARATRHAPGPADCGSQRGSPEGAEPLPASLNRSRNDG